MLVASLCPADDTKHATNAPYGPDVAEGSGAGYPPSRLHSTHAKRSKAEEKAVPQLLLSKGGKQTFAVSETTTTSKRSPQVPQEKINAGAIGGQRSSTSEGSNKLPIVGCASKKIPPRRFCSTRSTQLTSLQLPPQEKEVGGVHSKCTASYTSVLQKQKFNDLRRTTGGSSAARPCGAAACYNSKGSSANDAASRGGDPRSYPADLNLKPRSGRAIAGNSSAKFVKGSKGGKVGQNSHIAAAVCSKHCSTLKLHEHQSAVDRRADREVKQLCATERLNGYFVFLILSQAFY